MIATAEKILLNVGSGAPDGGQIPGMFASWRQVRVDIDPRVSPDIVADVTNLAAVAADSVDAVWISHCIEHLYEHDVPVALREIQRVLKNDGFGCILVPDLQRIASLIAEDKMHDPLYTSQAGPVTPHDIVFGFGPALARGHFTMAHKCGFTPTAMMRRLTAAGFGGYALLRRANYELAAVVRKTAWPDSRERDALLATLGL